MHRGKSDDKSEQLRAEANRLYVQKQFYDALLKYNESLCSAETESENLGLAYANRSAVYVEMKQFDKCLENIDMARKSRYPEKNYAILDKRAAKCAEMMKQETHELEDSDVWSSFKLSYPPHDKLPFIIKGLEMRTDSKYGRHIVTKIPLKIGDVIAIEEPSYRVIKADSRYSTCIDSNRFQRCANCLRENLLSLIPCPFCCNTMYCSIDCMNSAYKRHHRFECEIIEDLLASGLMHIVLRILFEGLSLFDDDLHEMERFLDRHGAATTVFDVNIQSLDESGELQRLRSRWFATVSLAVVDELQPLDGYKNVFGKTEKLEKLWNSHEKFIQKLLSKLSNVGMQYVHGIGGWPLKVQLDDENPKNPSFHQQLIGNGCYLFCSLLNHSCAPNLKRLNVEDKVIIIISREIKKGGQLFDSYRPNFNNQSKPQRQEALLKDYGFICECEACINDWPMNENLQVLSEQLLEYAWEAHEELPFLTPEDAKRKLKEYYVTFFRNQKHFPAAELIVLQECISNCLITLTKPQVMFP
jgi:SET and MYND domain-containing protein 4